MGAEYISGAYDQFVQSERFGIPAVIHEYKIILSHWDGNSMYLAELYCVLDKLTRQNHPPVDYSGQTITEKGNEYYSIYLCLLAETYRFAHDHLDRKDYHAFCQRIKESMLP